MTSTKQDREIEQARKYVEKLLNGETRFTHYSKTKTKTLWGRLRELRNQGVYLREYEDDEKIEQLLGNSLFVNSCDAGDIFSYREFRSYFGGIEVSETRSRDIDELAGDRTVWPEHLSDITPKIETTEGEYTEYTDLAYELGENLERIFLISDGYNKILTSCWVYWAPSLDYLEESVNIELQ